MARRLRAGRLAAANERKLDAAKSTLLEPVLSLRESDVAPMPKNSTRS